jgi:hypothetical protein
MIANVKHNETIWYSYEGVNIFLGRVKSFNDFEIITHEDETIIYYNNDALENRQCQNLAR